MRGYGRRSKAAVTAIALAAGLVGLAPAAAAPTEAERQQICADAEARYRQLTGRARQDEPVTVVLMFNNTFCPAAVTVKQGGVVRWVNVDRRTSHSVWFKQSGKPESERAFPEETVEMTIDLPPGEYPYLCGPHWEAEGMVGRMTVTGR